MEREGAMERKILVAVDGSVYSSNALRYVSRLFTDLEDIHFHLFSVVPCGALQPGMEWVDEKDMLTTMRPEVKNRYRAAKRYVNEAVLQLGRRGIAPEQVTTSVHLSRMGVAKDILAEAMSGMYDALLIGRRGMGMIEEMFMGSVSSTILEKSHSVPLWVVDGQVDSRKFLLPVDGSIHSLSAADHLGFILQDNPYAEITLFHSTSLFGTKTELKPEDVSEMWGKEWCDTHLTEPDCLYTAPKQLLLENGFSEERIHWLEAKKGIEPAQQILRLATKENFGTIVMGRRGKDTKKGIFKGVSDRVIFKAEHIAFWIIG